MCRLYLEIIVAYHAIVIVYVPRLHTQSASVLRCESVHLFKTKPECVCLCAKKLLFSSNNNSYISKPMFVIMPRAIEVDIVTDTRLQYQPSIIRAFVRHTI